MLNLKIYRNKVLIANKRVTFLKAFCLITILSLLLPGILQSQQSNAGNEYLWPEERSTALQIVVHIWGEVNKPGQYVVPDGTNVLELISLAGGPNEYSNLSNVRLTREYRYVEPISTAISEESNFSIKKEIYTINLNKHLKEKKYVYIQVLKPGDVITISHNKWYKFQTILRTIAQIAIVGQAFYYFSLISNRN